MKIRWTTLGLLLFCVAQLVINRDLRRRLRDLETRQPRWVDVEKPEGKQVRIRFQYSFDHETWFTNEASASLISASPFGYYYFSEPVYVNIK